MPASVCDPVSNALRLSLAGDESQNSSLDSRIYSSAKGVLLTKIDFEESGDFQSNVLDGLKSKYVVIRPKKPVLECKLKKETVCPNQTQDENKINEDGLPKPKMVLFPVEKIQLGWKCTWNSGAGMQNAGNTCYLNSTLQALFHVPAFSNWLISEGQHAEECDQKQSCIICGMRDTLLATHKSNGAPIKPWQIYSKLRQICRHLAPGRQEDAHEFLRYLVEAMEKCYLTRFVNSDKFDQYTKETTPLNQILGGYLRSTVRCLACQHLSTTYQHFQDLLLDIRKHNTIEEALESFFSRERLEDLSYKCEACNRKVSATKQFFIERAPMVLCIAFKRFSLVGGKLSKYVQFRKKINLSQFMYGKCNQSLAYKFVSVVTHYGPSLNCGHYTAIGQAPNNNFYQFDDSLVRQVPVSSVYGTNAYILFFEKVKNTSVPMASTSSVVYGPQLPDSIKEKSPLKLTYYKGDDKKPINLNSTSTDITTENKPILVNSTLSKSSELESSIRSNGVAKTNLKDGDDKKVTFVIKTQVRPSKSDSDIHSASNGNAKSIERSASTSKSVRQLKSPLEKLEEQMNKKECGGPVKNGWPTRLVPYESESSGDEPAAPSLHGDTLRRVKEKEGDEEDEKSPNTSLSSMSPLSDRSEAPVASVSAAVSSGTVETDTVVLTASTSGTVAVSTAVTTVTTGTLAAAETTRQLQHQSHRGYGAPVASWNGTHSLMSRQVFEEKRDERKRALEATDEMDRGRNKKVKKFHHYNRFNNNRNGYNPFQEKQNKPWGGGFKYRPQHHFHKHHNNKFRRFNRYSNGNHYTRHH